MTSPHSSALQQAMLEWLQLWQLHPAAGSSQREKGLSKDVSFLQYLGFRVKICLRDPKGTNVEVGFSFGLLGSSTSSFPPASTRHKELVQGVGAGTAGRGGAAELQYGPDPGATRATTRHELAGAGRRSQGFGETYFSQQENENEIEAEETDTSCRISGFKLPIQTSSPLTYAAVLKKQRQEPFPTYAPPYSAIHQKPKIKRGMLLERNARKDFFASHRTGVKLKALCDIDKYYSEQKKQESHKKRVTSVNMAQVAEERVNQTVQEFLNNKKYAAKKLIEKDNKTIQKNLQQICQDRLNYIEKVKERSALFLKEKERKATIRLLIQDLNNERTLLIQGMRKIDRCQGKEYLLKEKKQIVKQKREAEKYQREFLKQTKEIRTQEIYKRHCEEKFVNDMLAFQNAYERFQDAKANVAIVKMNFVNVLNGMGK